MAIQIIRLFSIRSIYRTLGFRAAADQHVDSSYRPVAGGYNCIYASADFVRPVVLVRPLHWTELL
jgi:hypothetical protein